MLFDFVRRGTFCDGGFTCSIQNDIIAIYSIKENLKESKLANVQLIVLQNIFSIFKCPTLSLRSQLCFSGGGTSIKVLIVTTKGVAVANFSLTADYISNPFSPDDISNWEKIVESPSDNLPRQLQVTQQCGDNVFISIDEELFVWHADRGVEGTQKQQYLKLSIVSDMGQWNKYFSKKSALLIESIFCLGPTSLLLCSKSCETGLRILQWCNLDISSKRLNTLWALSIAVPLTPCCVTTPSCAPSELNTSSSNNLGDSSSNIDRCCLLAVNSELWLLDSSGVINRVKHQLPSNIHCMTVLVDDNSCQASNRCSHKRSYIAGLLDGSYYLLCLELTSVLSIVGAVKMDTSTGSNVGIVPYAERIDVIWGSMEVDQRDIGSSVWATSTSNLAGSSVSALNVLNFDFYCVVFHSQFGMQMLHCRPETTSPLASSLGSCFVPCDSNGLTLLKCLSEGVLGCTSSDTVVLRSCIEEVVDSYIKLGVSDERSTSPTSHIPTTVNVPQRMLLRCSSHSGNNEDYSLISGCEGECSMLHIVSHQPPLASPTSDTAAVYRVFYIHPLHVTRLDIDDDNVSLFGPKICAGPISDEAVSILYGALRSRITSAIDRAPLPSSTSSYVPLLLHSWAKKESALLLISSTLPSTGKIEVEVDVLDTHDTLVDRVLDFAVSRILRKNSSSPLLLLLQLTESSVIVIVSQYFPENTTTAATISGLQNTSECSVVLSCETAVSQCLSLMKNAGTNRMPSLYTFPYSYNNERSEKSIGSKQEEVNRLQNHLRTLNALLSETKSNKKDISAAATAGFDKATALSDGLCVYTVKDLLVAFRVLDTSKSTAQTPAVPFELEVVFIAESNGKSGREICCVQSDIQSRSVSSREVAGIPGSQSLLAVSFWDHNYSKAEEEEQYRYLRVFSVHDGCSSDMINDSNNAVRLLHLIDIPMQDLSDFVYDIVNENKLMYARQSNYGRLKTGEIGLVRHMCIGSLFSSFVSSSTSTSASASFVSKYIVCATTEGVVAVYHLQYRYMQKQQHDAQTTATLSSSSSSSSASCRCSLVTAFVLPSEVVRLIDATSSSNQEIVSPTHLLSSVSLFLLNGEEHLLSCSLRCGTTGSPSWSCCFAYDHHASIKKHESFINLGPFIEHSAAAGGDAEKRSYMLHGCLRKGIVTPTHYRYSSSISSGRNEDIGGTELVIREGSSGSSARSSSTSLKKAQLREPPTEKGSREAQIFNQTGQSLYTKRVICSARVQGSVLCVVPSIDRSLIIVLSLCGAVQNNVQQGTQQQQKQRQPHNDVVISALETTSLSCVWKHTVPHRISWQSSQFSCGSTSAAAAAATMTATSTAVNVAEVRGVSFISGSLDVTSTSTTGQELAALPLCRLCLIHTVSVPQSVACQGGGGERIVSIEITPFLVLPAAATSSVQNGSTCMSSVLQPAGKSVSIKLPALESSSRSVDRENSFVAQSSCCKYASLGDRHLVCVGPATNQITLVEMTSRASSGGDINIRVVATSFLTTAGTAAEQPPIIAEVATHGDSYIFVSMANQGVEVFKYQGASNINASPSSSTGGVLKSTGLKSLCFVPCEGKVLLRMSGNCSVVSVSPPRFHSAAVTSPPPAAADSPGIRTSFNDTFGGKQVNNDDDDDENEEEEKGKVTEAAAAAKAQSPRFSGNETVTEAELPAYGVECPLLKVLCQDQLSGCWYCVSVLEGPSQHSAVLSFAMQYIDFRSSLTTLAAGMKGKDFASSSSITSMASRTMRINSAVGLLSADHRIVNINNSSVGSADVHWNYIPVEENILSTQLRPAGDGDGNGDDGNEKKGTSRISGFEPAFFMLDSSGDASFCI